MYEWIGFDFGDIHRMAQLLVQRGADVTKEDEWKETPLHNAAGRGNAECVKVCVKNECSRCNDVWCKVLVDAKANVDAKDQWGDTPLHYAARNGRTACVQVRAFRFQSLNLTTMIDPPCRPR
jgi:ankyrin repeat protein